jgi:hypothetical protein
MMTRCSLAGLSLFLLLFTLLAGGCQRSLVGEEADVSGTVFYKGKPLPGGHIKIASPKGHIVVAIIDPQGHYQCRAPVGEVQIAVENRMLKMKQSDQLPPPMPAGAPKPNEDSVHGTYVPLPEKYHAFETSGLQYKVKKGPQTYDIHLE